MEYKARPKAKSFQPMRFTSIQFRLTKDFRLLNVLITRLNLTRLNLPPPPPERNLDLSSLSFFFPGFPEFATLSHFFVNDSFLKKIEN